MTSFQTKKFWRKCRTFSRSTAGPCHLTVSLRPSTFVIAGTDTTSSALARILDLLSQHPDVQEKLRDEIRQARKNPNISYDDLVSLPYLDAVCRETLRL